MRKPRSWSWLLFFYHLRHAAVLRYSDHAGVTGPGCNCCDHGELCAVDYYLEPV